MDCFCNENLQEFTSLIKLYFEQNDIYKLIKYFYNIF